jgi:hypothetical protein
MGHHSSDCDILASLLNQIARKEEHIKKNLPFIQSYFISFNKKALL